MRGLERNTGAGDITADRKAGITADHAGGPVSGVINIWDQDYPDLELNMLSFKHCGIKATTQHITYKSDYIKLFNESYQIIMVCIWYSTINACLP